ncbi:hypothetical protein ACQKOM_02690 [Peribacillus frigoritolerans]|uniref:hypothetical protein n=1 Tax=Peribacillus frigoritolerans TaxID=450367 RepID=UPI003CFD4C2B
MKRQDFYRREKKISDFLQLTLSGETSAAGNILKGEWWQFYDRNVDNYHERR